MAQQLRIENSSQSIETVFDDRDFEDLLDKYLGYYLAKWFSNRISELKGKIEELETDEDDYK